MKPVFPELGARSHAYGFFRNAHVPRWGLTARVDVAPLLAALPAWRAAVAGLTPFVAYHHAVLRAANSVPALRQRLLQHGGAVEWPTLDASPTVLRSDESFAIALLPYAPRLRDFAEPALAAVAAAQQPGTPWSISSEPSGELHMTTLPLVAFTHFSHARRTAFDDATPSLALGKFQRDASSCWMPVNLEVHHALVDGLHVGRFFQALEALLAEPCQLW
jgi:chloramphenicol O-acetyltransferase type A